MEIAASTASPNAIAPVAALLARVFPEARRIDEAWLEWGYLENPLGPAIFADAREDGRVVAHIAGRPLLARIHGFDTPVRGVLVQHAATDASHRRRGLLGDLTERMLARASDDGASFAIAVLNRHSLGVFLDRLGFHNLQPLSVRFGIGALPPSQRDTLEMEFAPLHEPEWLAWRLAVPGNVYREQRSGGLRTLWADSEILGTPVLLGDLPASAPALPPLTTRSPLRAWVGRDPGRRFGGRPYLPVPLAIRPSPLHLVFRSLSTEITVPRAKRLRFEAIDFDAW